MTDKELQGMAAQSLNLAKTDMQYKHWRGFLLADYHVGRGLHRMRKVESLIIEKAGEEWLNYGGAKEGVFEMIRAVTNWLKPDAIVFVTAINEFKPTEKLKRLGQEKMQELADGGHDRHHLAVAEGLLTIHDAFGAIAQSEQRVCNYIQRKDGRLLVGQPEVSFVDQAHFDGRLKMYGGSGRSLAEIVMAHQRRLLQ